MADTQTTNPAQAAAEAAARAQAQMQAQNAPAAKSNDFATQVAQKIAEADNILVALSKDPSVDEMAAALGLTLFLDGLGKHATAIYSGLTPNALQFLKPGDTFEDNTNSLRDFIIALNKEKADHLRYKLDGDYVKVYITPYKTTIDEGDLEFSHGDYNVDLVVALNVPTANDLDAALTEHGRIMHDASAVDITTGEPGKFGEVEWSDTSASSVSELVTQLVLKLQSPETKMTAEEATALLTGIVAETERFSNGKTTPTAMAMASKLMEMGADQQLVATNITMEAPVMGAIDGNAPVDATAGNDPTALDVKHESTEPVVAAEPVVAEPVIATVVEQPAPVAEPAVEPKVEMAPPASEPVLNTKEKVIEPEADFVPEMENIAEPVTPAPAPVEEPVEEGPKDYGAMIDAALAEGVPAAPEKPEVNSLPEMDYTPQVTAPVESVAQPEPVMQPEPVVQPAMEPVLPQPENDVVLPPPPAPNVDLNQVMPTDVNGMPVLPQVQEAAPAQPVAEPQPQPVAQPQPIQQPQQPVDPSAFRIPGM